MADTGDGFGAIDTSKPHPARMYDYYLGGKDSYPVDWEAAEKVISLFPSVRTMARVNRSFMQRASQLLADRGVRQFLDIGTGIPTEPNLHQVVQKAVPEARVVYVDNDPIVLRHAEALLRGTSEGRTEYLQADVREVEKILEGAAQILDFRKPVALSLIALLHFITDEHDPRGIVRRLMEPLAPGSCLVLSHVSGEFDPRTWERVVQIYRENGIPSQARSRVELAAFFEGLELLDPGVELATRWRPDPGAELVEGVVAPIHGAVARKG
ncbi:SAM-dependent methyltransferase [Streptomyces sp. NPDC014894]|uniref:SAM-dependent methyltransferase n=1 Tax=unclassified Streptomyces TaxID=2593676 RepID=UPI0036FEBEC0